MGEGLGSRMYKIRQQSTDVIFFFVLLYSPCYIHADIYLAWLCCLCHSSHADRQTGAVIYHCSYSGRNGDSSLHEAVSLMLLLLRTSQGSGVKKMIARACSKLILHSCSARAKMKRQSVAHSWVGVRIFLLNKTSYNYKMRQIYFIKIVKKPKHK